MVAMADLQRILPTLINHKQNMCQPNQCRFVNNFNILKLDAAGGCNKVFKTLTVPEASRRFRHDLARRDDRIRMDALVYPVPHREISLILSVDWHVISETGLIGDRTQRSVEV